MLSSTQADLPHEQSRERLLDAATQLFARLGYARASVRDITLAAGCNVAAVNYHFGGKEALYAEVFRARLTPLREVRLRRLEESLDRVDGVPPLGLVLDTLVRAFLEPLVADASGPLTMQLMVHELLEPHLPSNTLRDEMMRPVQEAMAAALRRSVPDLPADAALRSVHSIVGQIVHALLSRDLFADDPIRRHILERESMVRHIVGFSEGGVRALAAAAAAPPRPVSSPRRPR